MAGHEEEEGDVIDFDRISDQEDDEEQQPRSVRANVLMFLVYIYRSSTNAIKALLCG